MKKLKLISLILAGVMSTAAIASLTACKDKDNEKDKHVHSYQRIEDEHTFKSQCSCGVLEPGYKVQLVYAEDGSYADAGINVVWKDKKTGKEVYRTTDDFGYVENLNLTENEYELYLYEDSLPEVNGIIYTYDRSAFKKQTNGIGLKIGLFPSHEPSNINDPSVTGRLTSTEDRYSIELDKTYIAEFKNTTDEIWYTVQNRGLGKYTVSVNTATDCVVNISRHAANIAYVQEEPDSKVDASTPNKLTYTVVASDGSGDSTFKLSLPSAPFYPIEIPFSVSITYVPVYDEADRIFVQPTHFKTLPSTYTYYVSERGTGELEAVTVDSLSPILGTKKWQDIPGAKISSISQEKVSGMNLGDDGYYYTAEGEMVYARIDAPSIFEASTLATLIDTNTSYSKYRVAEYDPEYEYITKNEDYFGFVMAYNALTNSDGIYPLTEEMHRFLSYLAKKEHASLNQLLCLYNVIITDWTNGSGTEADPYQITVNDSGFGSYKLTVPEADAAYVTLNGNEEVTVSASFKNLKITANGAEYTQSFHLSVNGSITLKIESVDGKAQDVTLSIEKYIDPSVLSVGDNSLTAPNGTQQSYSFTPTEAGEYNISISSSSTVTVIVTVNGETYVLGATEEGDGHIAYSATVSLSVDDTVTIKATSNIEDKASVFTLTIDKNS